MRDGRVGAYTDVVAELVLGILKVRVEGARQGEAIAASHYFELADQCEAEHCVLIGQQIPQLDGKRLVFLCRALRHDRSISGGHRVLVSLLRLLLVGDLCLDDSVVNRRLEMGDEGGRLQREDIRALDRLILVGVDVSEVEVEAGRGTLDTAIDSDSLQWYQRLLIILL